MIQEIREYITTTVEIPAGMWSLAPMYRVYSRFEVWILEYVGTELPEFRLFKTQKSYIPETGDEIERGELLRLMVKDAKRRAMEQDDHEPIILYERYEQKPITQEVRTVRQLVND